MAPSPRKFPTPLIVIAALVVLGGGAAFYSMKAGGPAPQTQPQGGPPVTVANPLKQQVTDWTEYTGQFTPVDFVEVRARVSGYLTEIHFTDGQYVKKGDLLFVIDPRPYENAVIQARSRLRQASSSKDFASRQLDRAGALQKRDFLAQSTLDQRENESQSANAEANAAIAAVRDAELNLEFTRVVSPISGRVSARNISIGNLVNGGGASGTGTLLTTIVSQDPVYFSFDMSESDYLNFQRARQANATLSAAQLDIPVDVRLMDEKDWPHSGRLTFIDNAVDRSSGTIRARATIPNPDAFIAAGSFGRIRLPGTAPFEALLVPEEALATDQSRRIVMTVTPDGTVAPRPVELGPQIGQLRAIRSGLKPDDQVIINGLMRARPGAKVTPQPGKIETAPSQPAQ